jgi:rhodanese-related sulfurtransferase
VALTLMEKGYTMVSVLKGGWDEWLGSGFPTDPK